MEEENLFSLNTENCKYILKFFKKNLFYQHPYECAYNKIKSCNCMTVDYVLFMGKSFLELSNACSRADKNDSIQELICQQNKDYFSYKNIDAPSDDLDFYIENSMIENPMNSAIWDQFQNVYLNPFLQFCLYAENYFSDNDELKKETIRLFLSFLVSDLKYDAYRQEFSLLIEKLSEIARKVQPVEKSLNLTLAKMFYLEAQNKNHGEALSVSLIFISQILLDVDVKLKSAKGIDVLSQRILTCSLNFTNSINATNFL